MTNDQAQSIVNELREVCERHGVALVAVDTQRGEYADIEIVPLKGMPPDDAERVTNVPLVSAFMFRGNEFITVSVSGIGAKP